MKQEVISMFWVERYQVMVEKHQKNADAGFGAGIEH